MKHLLKSLIERTPIYTPLRNWVNVKKQKKELIDWERRGKPVPPPHIVKQQVIKDFAEKYGLKILVETGTYYGDMVEAMKCHFDRLYSIELSNELYRKAKRRFEGDKRIEIIHGDSGIELGKLLERIDQPALFWLDGHYSAGDTAKGDKDTPIYEELNYIFSTQNSGHVVVIDDARCFGNDPAYPTIKELSDFIKTKKPESRIEVECDSIRITPSSVSGQAKSPIVPEPNCHQARQRTGA